MKKRFLMIIALAILLVLGLSGCGRKPKVIALVAGAPDEVVTDGTFNFKTMKVYRIFDTGQVQVLTEGDYAIELKNPEGAASIIGAGIREVVITDMNYKDPKDKKKNIQTSIKVVDKSLATDPNGIHEGDSFLTFQFKEVVVGEGKQAVKRYAFTHQLGYSFNKDEVSDYLRIFKITNVGNETVQLDVTEEVAAELKNAPAEDFEIRYKTGVYDEVITSGTTKGTINVVVVGGEKPIHSKSANWFDYILVIPVGFIMQLFSFGGIYALGILFATIIIRTLAWPIYAKTNQMSAKMAEAQPDLQRLQAKYRGRTDKASQQQMQIETMQIYKKHKIGMGTMFLPFLQMPIFIAMYQTVTRILVPGGYWAAKITNTKFLGIELSIGSHWTSYILAGLVGVTMILLQWITTRKPKHLKNTAQHKKDEQAAQTERTMKIVSYIMVVMMVIFAFRSNALALYWIVGNLFSLGQSLLQKQINKKQFEKKQDETLGGILWNE